MKNIIGVLLFIGGIVCGLYVGCWVMFIQPIISVCQAFDTGALTGTIIGIAVLKCIFSGTVGWIIAYAGMKIGSVFLDEK